MQWKRWKPSGDFWLDRGHGLDNVLRAERHDRGGLWGEVAASGFAARLIVVLRVLWSDVLPEKMYEELCFGSGSLGRRLDGGERDRAIHLHAIRVH